MADKKYVKGFIAGVLCATIVAAGGFLGYKKVTDPAKGTLLSDESRVQKLEYLESLIDEYYLEDKDEDALAEGVYAGLIYGLGDVYSRYYTAEEYEAENTSNEGSYVGIGVTIQTNPDGGILIVDCTDGGPGDEAGLLAGDIITAVDGTDVTDAESSEVSEMIRNSEADSTVLTIQREGEENALEITVPITDVELISVSSEMLDDHVGYIKITEFKGVTSSQYQTAFEELKSQGMEKLVVDLRDNPGGLLSSVCDVLRQILPEGLIVYTEDKYGNREEETCDGENELDMPLAVLVNQDSASASEIFAGAVQDYGIGTIVGTMTYGKGIVQSIRTLSDGSAVKLTVSKYYTPNGNNIHGTGITPDVEVELDSSLLAKDDYTHEEDNQLAAALEVLSRENG